MKAMTAKDDLKKYSLAALKGGIGSIPGGSLVVELLNVTIPDRRLERIEKILMILASKELDMDSEEIKQKFHSPEFSDIFEDVIHQAVKALSDKRLEYLASILEKSLTDEEIKHLQTKRLLEILKEINDVEIILLQSYEKKSKCNQNFDERHSNIFNFSNLEPDKAQEHKVMLENYNSHLINLGLIGKSSSFDSFSRNRQISEYDLYITELGRMLLEKIGIEQDSNGVTGEPINPMDAINSALNKLEQKEREIRQELEEDAKKAKQVIESEIRRFERTIRRGY